MDGKRREGKEEKKKEELNGHWGREGRGRSNRKVGRMNKRESGKGRVRGRRFGGEGRWARRLHIIGSYALEETSAQHM